MTASLPPAVPGSDRDQTAKLLRRAAANRVWHEHGHEHLHALGKVDQHTAEGLLTRQSGLTMVQWVPTGAGRAWLAQYDEETR